MFNSKKETAIKIPDNFGEGFIHTMKDDLYPPLKSASPSASAVGTGTPFSGSGNPGQPASQPISSSPFLVPSSPTKNTIASQNVAPSTSANQSQKTFSAPATGPIIEKDPKAYANEPIHGKKSSGLKSVIILVIAVLIILALSGAGYYLWLTSSSSEEAANENPQENTPAEENAPTENNPPEETVKISPLSEKYFSDRPNTISIDIETMEADGIKKALSDAAKETGQLQSKEPFEFIIKDAKNNSVAFPIFSTAAEIGFSQELLSGLEEDFSFYAYEDQGKTRTGLSIKTRASSSDVLIKMLKEEGTLVKTLSFLFLYENFSDKSGPFLKNTYNGISSRYLNLDDANSISIDYGVYEDRLIIATSKNTFRAIIDKMLSDKQSSRADVSRFKSEASAMIPMFIIECDDAENGSLANIDFSQTALVLEPGYKDCADGTFSGTISSKNNLSCKGTFSEKGMSSWTGSDCSPVDNM